MNKSAVRKISSLLDDDTAYLAATPADLVYLSGASFDGFALIVAAGGRVVPAAGRMTYSQTRDFLGRAVVCGASVSAAAAAAARSLGIGKVLVSGALAHNSLTALRKSMRARGIKVSVSSISERVRIVKDRREIAILGENQAVARRAVEIVGLRALKTGIAEKEVKRRIDGFFMSEGGAAAFDTIVAFGRNTAYPHHVSGDARLGASDIVVIDAGFRRNGYVSDLTRTYLLGKISSAEKSALEIVKSAQKSAISAVRAGVSCADVDAAARKAITIRGYGGAFIHGTGHGLGVEVHEGPSLSEKSFARLQAAMTVTVEPGIYIEGKFGVRVEDAVVVTETGCEVL